MLQLFELVGEVLRACLPHGRGCGVDFGTFGELAHQVRQVAGFDVGGAARRAA